MRYPHNREQSAEFLRLALPLMASQAAALHPVSYTLWYEHVAGTNPQLSGVLDARLKAHKPLTDDDVYELYARHILPSDHELLERLQQKLTEVLEEAAQAVAAVAEDTGRYGQTLEATRTQLSGAVSLEGVRDLLAELIRETLHIRSTAQAASERLDGRTQEVRRLTEQLEQARTEALLDPLTGLKNRRGLERAVEELEQIDGAALLVVDIDHFKQINDTHGHLLGDKALRAIGRILNENIKRRDLVGRWGGEEFAILLLRTLPEGARAVAEHVRAAIASLRIRRADGTELDGQITASFGIAVAQDGESFDDLMTRADAALYRAKRDGRNRVCVAGQ